MINQVGYESPTTMDYIGGIPISWFREIDHACDVFFTDRGITFSTGGFRAQAHAEAQAAEQRKRAAGHEQEH